MAPPKAPDNEYYEVRAVPGKGYGCFALKELKRGTRILSDAPLLAIESGYYMKEDVEEKFRALSKEEQELYFSLASSHGQDPKQWPSLIHPSVTDRERTRISDQHAARIAPEVSILSIFQTNCMTLGSGAGVFPHAARFNHSCQPNATFTWNAAIARETIHTIRDVPQGEQLTLSYCDLTHEKTLREYELKHYGFVCDCEACTADEDSPLARRHADQRYQIAELEHATGPVRMSFKEGMDKADAETVQRLLSMAALHMEVGDYSMRLADIYFDLALACEAAEDWKNGPYMAANALRIARDVQGADAPDFDKYQVLVKRMHKGDQAGHEKK